jgi:FkbM family methyltransferase
LPRGRGERLRLCSTGEVRVNQSSADHASPQLEGRPAEAASAGLVMDIGVAGGADTAFYLAKGFRVISVEAGASACEKLSRRFAEPIAAGTLQLLRFIADSTFGLPRDFHVHKVHQGISGVSMHMREDLVHDYAHETALTIDWKTLIAQQGVPRYAKIDIEGNEENFLSGIAATGRLPEFISIECHKLPPVEMLYDMGYRRFRLVDQNPAGGFKLPCRQFEGRRLASYEFVDASGSFGLDLFSDGTWLDFDFMRAAWYAAEPRRQHTWFDCHAWRPG